MIVRRDRSEYLGLREATANDRRKILVGITIQHDCFGESFPRICRPHIRAGGNIFTGRRRDRVGRIRDVDDIVRPCGDLRLADGETPYFAVGRIDAHRRGEAGAAIVRARVQQIRE